MNVDYFVIPITGDIYNQYGIKNIGTWITNWIKIYNRSLGYLIDDYDEQTLAAVSINKNISLKSYKKFLGYIISRAKTSKRGNGREQKIISYQQKHFDDIEMTINEALKFATNNKIKNSLELGKITEIISLLTESQAQHKPPFARVSQMIALNQQWGKDSVQNSEYAIMRTFEDIAENIQRNIEVLENV